MFHYHFVSAFEGRNSDEIPVLVQIATEATALLNFISQFWWSAVPIWVDGATEVCEGGVEPDG